MTPSRQRYDLTVFRGIACLSILVFHAYQYNRDPHTWNWPLQGTVWHELLVDVDVFVSMFFVLSGFLLALPYVRSILDGTPHRYARAFLIRRAVRILPAYYVVVLVVWAVSNPELPGDWRDLIQHLTFTHVFDSQRIFFTDGPAWSLADEVYYYLLLAVLGALAQPLCRRLPSRRRKITVLVAAACGLIAISTGYKLLSLLVWHRAATDFATWFGPLSHLDAFAIGLLLAIAAGAGVRWTSRRTRWTVGLLGTAVLLVGLSTRQPIIRSCTPASPSPAPCCSPSPPWAPRQIRPGCAGRPW
ncbi:acyltransferase [Streptomyces sp. T-3]|nr:acyltransferase [Streptomyces sp. T-3]